METKSIPDEIVILYDRLHELYVDSIRFYDICQISECVICQISECAKYTEELHNLLYSVNECMTSIVFGGMGTNDFLDEVDLNSLYKTVFYMASEVQNAVIEGPNNNDLIELQSKIHNNVDAIYVAVQDIMKIFIEVFNN